MWRRVHYCVSQEHFTDVLAPKGDEKLTGFSCLHKSIFHPNRLQIRGKISLHSGQRQEALLKSLTTPPPLISEDSYCNPESPGDRHRGSNNGHTNMFKDGEAGQRSGVTGVGPERACCHLG